MLSNLNTHQNSNRTLFYQQFIKDKQNQKIYDIQQKLQDLKKLHGISNS